MARPLTAQLVQHLRSTISCTTCAVGRAPRAPQWGGSPHREGNSAAPLRGWRCAGAPSVCFCDVSMFLALAMVMDHFRSGLSTMGTTIEVDTIEKPPCCKDCGKVSPRTDTSYTLISSRHGWRLSFDNVNGYRTSVWRCPECWKAFKGRS